MVPSGQILSSRLINSEQNVKGSMYLEALDMTETDRKVGPDFSKEEPLGKTLPMLPSPKAPPVCQQQIVTR